MEKKKLQEKKELELLNGKNGFVIETKVFGRIRKWKVNHFTLGLMDMQSLLFHQLETNESLTSNTSSISTVVGKSVKANAKICAEIIAISVLGKRWKIFLFKNVLKQHFLWQIDSAKLLQFASNLFVANNYKDFMTSIALMSTRTTTSPETAEADPIEDSEAPTE